MLPARTRIFRISAYSSGAPYEAFTTGLGFRVGVRNRPRAFWRCCQTVTRQQEQSLVLLRGAGGVVTLRFCFGLFVCCLRVLGVQPRPPNYPLLYPKYPLLYPKYLLLYPKYPLLRAIRAPLKGPLRGVLEVSALLLSLGRAPSLSLWNYLEAP